MSYYAQLLLEPGRLAYQELDDPAPRAGEIVVEIAVALTDGTDLKAFRRGHPKIAMPGPFGHEFAGTVAAVGAGVERWRVGQRIVATHTAPCRDCFFCRVGQPNLCERFLDTITMGAYAGKLTLPAIIHEQNAFAIPDGVSFERAACLEPLSCVVHGQRLVAPVGFAGESVLILGAGSIGLMHLMLAQRRGAGRTAVLGRREERLALARELGADATDEVAERVRDCGGPCGFDVVIECAGTIEAWHAAFALTRPGGRLLLFGGPPTGTTITYDTARLHYGEITVLGCFHYTPDDVRAAFDWIAEGELPLERLITHRLPLAQLEQAFAGMMRGEGLKYAILPNAS